MFAGSLSHPGIIIPLVFFNVPDDGCVFWPHLRREGHGVGFGDHVAMVMSLDLVFVDITFRKAGEEQFPDAVSRMKAHRMAAAVPIVEVSHNADTHGVGSPD